MKDSNLNVTLIDSDKIGFGATSKTTGKLTYLQDTLTKIKSVYGTEVTRKYIESQKYAIELIKTNVIEHNIKCNFESNNSYVFTNQNKDKKVIKDLDTILKKANTNHKKSFSLPIKYPCKLNVKVNDTAVFHPVKYVLTLKDICLKRGINMKEPKQ